jgi:hypothetical protein
MLASVSEVVGRTPCWCSRTGDMVAALCNEGSHANPDRGVLLRLLDALAAWQMRYSHQVISRVQPLNATMTGVTQSSSVNERSSTRPCDR